MKSILESAWVILLPFLLTLIITLGLTRGCAFLFAKPDASFWEDAYVLDSPNAKCFHHDTECKFFTQSKYDYDIMSVKDAEKRGYVACQLCLEENRVRQFDGIGVAFFPFLFVFIGWFMIDYLPTKYSFRSPIVRRKNHKTK